MQQVQYTSNFKRFQTAVSNLLTDRRRPGYTIGDIFESFEEAGAFCLKVIYHHQGRKVKVDYNLSLSCYSFSIKRSALQDESAETPTFTTNGAAVTSNGKPQEPGRFKEGAINTPAALQATTVSQRRTEPKIHFGFSEEQPPHLRICLPEQVFINAESGELNLQTKLSDISTEGPPSFFAVHFGYLKATPADHPPTAIPHSLKSSALQTHFLAYFRLDPAEERAFLVGLLPLKIDTDNTDFWVGFQEGEVPPGGYFQYKQGELEAIRLVKRAVSDCQRFVEGGSRD
jgi:hypothetical protein